MSQRDKLLARIRNNPSDVSLADLTSTLEGRGFPLKRTNKHFVYSIGKRIVTVPGHPLTVKAYIVKQVLDALDETYGQQENE